MKSISVIILFVIIGYILLNKSGVHLLNHFSHDEKKSGNDNYYDTLIEKKGVEITQIIGKKKILLGELDLNKSTNILNFLITNKAKRVFAVKAESDGEYLGANNFIIELPDDPKFRKPIFDEMNKLITKQGFDSEKDEETKYLFVGFK